MDRPSVPKRARHAIGGVLADDDERPAPRTNLNRRPLIGRKQPVHCHPHWGKRLVRPSPVSQTCYRESEWRQMEPNLPPERPQPSA